MDIRHRRRFRPLRDERGFTLSELLTTIAILGILLAIAMAIWNSVIEARRVDAAANQLASDMRLAHTRATNQLTDWRVVIYPERGEEEKPDGSPNPDYYLVKLDEPYGENDATLAAPNDPPTTPPIPRTLPANVEIMQETTSTPIPIVDDTGITYYLNPSAAESGDTRTLEFNSDGTMWGYLSPSGTVRVTIDGDPQRGMTYVAATSRVELD